MDAATKKTAADLLCQARILGTRLAELPLELRPATPQAGYECQDQVVKQLLAHYGGTIVGYKVACTNRLAQELLNQDGPFCGSLMSAVCFDSPAQLPASNYAVRVMEAEFAFRMGRDLPAASEPLSREVIEAAIETAIPSIEIVDSRFTSWTTVGAPSLIADCACNAGWVKGPEVPDWRGVDLAEQPVRLIVNGEVAHRGSGAAVLGHPLNAIRWLVDTLHSRGLGLKKGHWVTTGVTTDVYLAEAGDHVVADFGPIGTAEVTFQ